MMDAMLKHPLLQGLDGSQSETLTGLCSRKDTAKRKADEIESLVLTLLSMVALWRSLQPWESRPAVAEGALKTVRDRSVGPTTIEHGTEVYKIPEPIVALLKQASQGGKAYMS